MLVHLQRGPPFVLLSAGIIAFFPDGLSFYKVPMSGPMISVVNFASNKAESLKKDTLRAEQKCPFHRVLRLIDLIFNRDTSSGY